MTSFRSTRLLVAAVLVVAVPFAQHAAAVEVGDWVTVTAPSAELRRGFEIVAVIRAGQEFQVRKISGEWIGTAVEVGGELKGGWIQQDAVVVVRKAAVGGAPKPEKTSETPKKTVVKVPAAVKNPSDIIAHLSSQDGVQQFAALDAVGDLGAAGTPAVPKLIELLSAESAQLRWRAARALSALGSRSGDAVPDLAKALRDSNALVRAHAARALGEIGAPSRTVVGELGKLIADPDVRVRRAVVAAWRKIRPGPEVSVPILVKVLEDSEDEVKVQVVMAIAEAGRDAVPGLIEGLKNDKARYWACLALKDIGTDAKEAAPAIVPLLKAEEPQVRLQALMALASIGVTDAAHVAAILPLLKDPENSVRYAANYAVTRIGPAAKAAADVLKGNLEDADSFLAATSAWALARVSEQDAESLDLAIAKLIASLKDKNQRTRVIAAKALTELKPSPEKVGAALAEALHDVDAEVMANVIEALAAHGEAVLPRAVQALENEKLRLPAIHLLQRLGPKAKSAAPALVSALKSDQREEVRREVIHALQAIGAGSADGVAALIALLTDDSVDVRKAATYALGKMGPDAKDALAAIRANASKEGLRPVSMWAMVLIAPQDQEIVEQATPLLMESLKREEGVVRFEAAQALGVIGARARSALPALEAARDDADMHVRRAVLEAIKKIGG